jgi:hypothetical protein
LANTVLSVRPFSIEFRDAGEELDGKLAVHQLALKISAADDKQRGHVGNAKAYDFKPGALFPAPGGNV